MGLGVYATRNIPKGTITFVRDPFDMVFQSYDLISAPFVLVQEVLKLSYREPSGEFVLSWDNGKYMNHSCEANTLTTSYGFEIAVHDIAKGEEITDDYGLLNLDEPFHCLCNKPRCRRLITEPSQEDLVTWEAQIAPILATARSVPQPLEDLITWDHLSM